MTAAQDRLLDELDELTAQRREAQAAEKKATDRAETVVRRALLAGVTVRELTDRPFSRAWVQNMKREMKRRGEIK